MLQKVFLWVRKRIALCPASPFPHALRPSSLPIDKNPRTKVLFLIFIFLISPLSLLFSFPSFLLLFLPPKKSVCLDKSFAGFGSRVWSWGLQRVFCSLGRSVGRLVALEVEEEESTWAKWKRREEEEEEEGWAWAGQWVGLGRRRVSAVRPSVLSVRMNPRAKKKEGKKEGGKKEGPPVPPLFSPSRLHLKPQGGKLAKLRVGRHTECLDEIYVL